MPRNLDLTSLRSFVAVADSGGVTKAAGHLHLTQSAVSMQLKRLEEALDVSLLDRSNRSVSLTAEGEQLLSYARRMLALNDEIYTKLTAQEYEGEISLGVPHDIIYPYIPPILRRFAGDFPRVQIKLVSAPTMRLREMFGRGECDAILTTEEQPGPGGEALVELPLVWIGAEGGTAWKQRPLPVAFCTNCIFRPGVLKRLDDVGVAWEPVVYSDLDNAVEAVVSADLGVHAAITGVYPRQTAPIPHDGALPDPGKTQIALYLQSKEDPVLSALRAMIHEAYGADRKIAAA
ncbi:LysR family transcriptional regulator [Litoreibacter ponti]|uniref:LysR family transcriptional regulator n=1 Tax=Litoreibacter ponti TaxID=1510457 RepID=A0A2T6BDJ0_9RHOB|nr:LysR family transcriptional regulator [Litoreibacter ponti]PTX54130.1 LysR family transcriptional regulator [Litoreibacter ponti]